MCIPLNDYFSIMFFIVSYPRSLNLFQQRTSCFSITYTISKKRYPCFSLRFFSSANPSKTVLDFLLNFLDTLKDSPECFLNDDNYIDTTPPRVKTRISVFDYLNSNSFEYKEAFGKEYVHKEMQHKLESLSLCYDMNDFFKKQPDIFNLLIKKDTESAKEILLNKFIGKKDLSRIVKQLEEYTLEAASIYTLCNLFHASSKSTVVRAATFIDSLAYTIEYHYSVSISRNKALGEKGELPPSLQTESEKVKITELDTKSKAQKHKPVSKASEFHHIASKMLDLLPSREKGCGNS
jgi:hypothetical protein